MSKIIVKDTEINVVQINDVLLVCFSDADYKVYEKALAH